MKLEFGKLIQFDGDCGGDFSSQIIGRS